jgi:xanthine dehydrogenase accessory factor
MDYALAELCRFYALAKLRTEPMVLATILRTEASTYRKAGARILIGADGKSSGMLSGGCLEADLRERAARVLSKNRPARHWFDTRESDDPVWGLGMGCEGAMDVWLQPVAAADQYRPLDYLQHCLESETAGTVATVVGGQATPSELGRHGHTGGPVRDSLDLLLSKCTATRAELRPLRLDERELEVFVAPVGLPPSVLLCGGGLDAIPVHAFAAALGWRVTVYDHRPAFASREQFPQAARVILGRPEELARHLEPAKFSAAIVMSHHLASDVTYLKWLAAAPPAYIGLLGPPARRQRLLAEAGAAAHKIASRIHGPVGLDIGAGTPEAIALAIVAQIHAVLAGRTGGPFEGARTPDIGTEFETTSAQIEQTRPVTPDRVV